MKNKLLFTLLIPGLLLTSCNQQASSSSSSLIPSSSSIAPIEPLTYRFYTIEDNVRDLSFIEGYPWINTSYVGVIDKIKKPSPKDDYYLYANHDKLAGVTIPEGEDQAGGFTGELKKTNEDNLNALFNDNNTKLVGIRDALIKGAKDSVKAEINKILSYSLDDINALFASSNIFKGLSTFIQLNNNVANDIITLGFDEMPLVPGLPTYIQALGSLPKDDLKKDIRFLAGIEGVEESRIDNIVNAIDTMSALFAAVKEIDSQTIHETTVGSLDSIFTGAVNVKSALKELGYADEKVVAYNDYELALIKEVDKLVASNKLDDLRYILAANKVSDSRFFLGTKVYKEQISDKIPALGRITANNPEFKEDATDNDVARAMIERVFPQAMKRAYVTKFIKGESRERVKAMVEDVIGEYENIFKVATWLTSETIDKAIEKLHAMHYAVFYEDKYVSIDPYTVDSEDDALEVFTSYHDYVLSNMVTGAITNDAVGKERCDTINAYYIPDENTFYVCHGICSSYIDEENLSKEKLYGMLGTIVGHEVSHGFDSIGSLYDKDGKEQEWWTATDREKFDEKVAKLANYYNSKIRCFNDLPSKGENMSSEIIADMGGMRVIDNIASKDSNFNYEKFYSSYAYFFSFVLNKEMARSAASYDTHPLQHLRVNVTLGQFPKFAEIYGVGETNGMYIPTEDIVAIW